MDQELAWWAQVVFIRWRDRPGPRYQGVAAAVLDAVDTGALSAGRQLPAERLLADALGVSRGTVVAAYDRLVAAGVARRRQGAGTFVAGRPGWLRGAPPDPSAVVLLRRLAARESLDLSLSVPPGTDHLPTIDWDVSAALTGHGLDPLGLAPLRDEVAAHLTERQALPTTPDQLVITAGAQQALAVLAAVAARRATVVTGCPHYPGVRSALAGRPIRIATVPADGPAGIDPDALGRAARKVEAPLVHVMPTGANPTGAVMPAHRREALLAAAHRAGALVIEDLALTDLVYGAEPPPPPLAALDPGVVAIGTTSKLLWAGLRVGWIRADEPLRAAIVRAKTALDLATSLPAQHLAARLLAAVDDRWLHAVRRGLAERRDHLARRLTARLPSWRFDAAPAAGLSLWAELPIADADAFGHVAARHGVVVAPGSMLCGCGRHRGHVRLSFAQPVDELDLAAERLASAWEVHSEDLAALPARV